MYLNPFFTEEFFPDFQMEGSSTYFVRACAELTDTDKQEVYKGFAEKLNEKGIICKLYLLPRSKL